MTKEEARELGHDGLPLWAAFKQFAADRNWQLSNFSPNDLEEAYETFNAGYDFAKSESNGRAVIDGFLARVRDELKKGYFTREQIVLLDLIFNIVAAEMFGKEGE